ncbi:MAG: glycosyltransferase, partial [Thiovulaceae bacterium]|nr:glycosyltransferase [Sulfurimonadaceae bacterium]
MRLCITGGGTGGHLMIADALLQAALPRKHETIFIGSTSGQDQKYFKENSKFSHVYFLPTSGVVNKKGLGKIGALWRIFKAFFTARTLLRKHKIQALYSVGGFSAAPAALAAISLRIPLFIHEQNAVTGRLNALLKPFAKRFISAYDTNSPIRGYPVKQLFSSHSRIRKNVRTVIFLGGSQGAKAINDLALRVAPELQKKGISIIHQCGENDFERVKEVYETLGVEAELYGFT